MPSLGLDHALLDRFWLDHLWQSTLFAVAVGLLVLAFRRGPAGVRYGLWLAASIKFLVPFAALAALGRLAFGMFALPRLVAPVVHAPAAADFLERAARPLSQFAAQFPRTSGPLSQTVSAIPTLLPASPAAQVAASAAGAAPHLDWALILWGLWAVGCAVVLARWMTQVIKVRSAVRGASPLAWTAPMPVLASPSLMEPGLVGLLRPVLMVPETLVARLGQAQIDALVAHEAGHLRRRDNLTAAIHMLVEAVVWFHPLVWWIGARLIEERERACDDAVVRAGHDRAAYARSIVDICRLCLQSPLPCVSGVTGSNLITRVERIMTSPIASPLSRSGKALLAAAASFAFATPVAAGLLTPRESVAPLAKAVAAIAAPAHAFAAAQGPDQDPAKAPVALARNEVVLGPNLAVAATDAAPLALTQTLAAPRLDPEASQVAQPMEVASAAPSIPASQPIERTDLAAQASAFVRAYAAAAGKREVVARWLNPICVVVTGLAKDQTSAVKARVEEVAKGVGLSVQPAGCAHPDIEIGFTTDPQSALNGVLEKDDRVLGDPTSGTATARTVTLPIQAWYQTNGRDLAANHTGPLKALADVYSDSRTALKIPALYQGPNADGPANDPVGHSNYGTHIPPNLGDARQFLNVLVIADVKRTGRMNLRPISDYVAMLALSQPKSLGRCNTLPSITDLFAACPGRAAPQGLTSADAAYLHALYAADNREPGAYVNNSALLADVAGAMAPLLSAARPVAPAALRAPPTAPPEHPAPTVAAVAPADLKTQASAFAQSYAATVGKRQIIARWLKPLCIGVSGLADDQAAAVKARVEEVAKAIGVSLQLTGCGRWGIEIGFTTDPQGMLNGVIKADRRLLGDSTSGTKSAKTVTLPIQAWYLTNGRELAANDGGGLKALADYRADSWAGLKTPVLYQGCGPGQSTCPSTSPGSSFSPYPYSSPPTEPDWPADARQSRPNEARQFQNVFVIVDLKRTGDMSLGLIADYVTMLALSQPRSLGNCNALPSITDLFAGACPDRGPPHGLTLADTAYLKALYAADRKEGNVDVNNAALLPHVVDGMAPLLANAKVAAR